MKSHCQSNPKRWTPQRVALEPDFDQSWISYVGFIKKCNGFLRWLVTTYLWVITRSTRSRIFCGHLVLKVAPRFSGWDSLEFAAGAAFFRPFLGGGAAVWLGPASSITRWVEADACLARGARFFFAAGGLGLLGSSELEALAERVGLVRVFFVGGIPTSGSTDGNGSDSWLIDIWGWTGAEGFHTTNSPFRFRLLRTISEHIDGEEGIQDFWWSMRITSGKTFPRYWWPCNVVNPDLQWWVAVTTSYNYGHKGFTISPGSLE